FIYIFDNGMMDMYLDGEYVDKPLTQRAKTPVILSLSPRVNKNRLPMPVRVYRRLSRSNYYATRFKGAWLFMDRDTQADDNAEHLYRYVRKHHPDINAWFVLRRTSHDWQRLKNEEFRLLAFSSLA